MRKLVALLSLTTVIFGTSTAWLAWRLYGNGASQDEVAMQTRPATSPLAASRHETDTTVNAANEGSAARPETKPGSAVAPASARAAGAASAADKNREVMLPIAQKFLARFDDPVQHAALIAETRNGLRRQYDPLRQKLKLDASTYNQLLDLLSEQSAQNQADYFRCLVDAGCNPNEFTGRQSAVDPDLEVAALLGPQRMDELRSYRESLGERDSVAQLRGRLTDANMLPDVQAEKLVTALADEETRYKKEITAQGSTPYGWGTPLGMLWYTKDGSSVDQQLSQAAAYSQRLRDRAATILTPQQLAIFAQMQDELLAMMTSYLRPAP